MAVGKAALAAALISFAIPASAAVQVLGASNARLCFESADSQRRPDRIDVQRCDAAIRLDNLTAEEIVATHINRGILRLRAGDVDAAIVDFDTALALAPNQPEAYVNKASALLRREANGEAARLFTLALEHGPRRPELAFYGRAVANEALGYVGAAYRDYRRASELAPRWSAPRDDLSRFRVIR